MISKVVCVSLNTRAGTVNTGTEGTMARTEFSKEVYNVFKIKYDWKTFSLEFFPSKFRRLKSRIPR